MDRGGDQRSFRNLDIECDDGALVLLALRTEIVPHGEALAEKPSLILSILITSDTQ